MNRLFEFSDQAWLPRLFRDLLTELLQHQLVHFRIYAPVVGKLNEVLRRSGCTRILDLCSGSGGPLLQLRPLLRVAGVTLSDRHPCRWAARAAVASAGVSYLPYPVDARAVPPHLEGCRTLFTSLHHFDPVDARRVLGCAVDAGAAIAVFEFTERHLARVSSMLLSAPRVWRDTWTMRPRRWARWLWTYVVPVVPALYMWDGLVSHCRSYTAAELLALSAEFTGYAWEAGTLAPERDGVRITYLVGRPAG